MYDARLGRWLSMDPNAVKYPALSPYNFVGNSPILFVDYDGRDYGVYINHKTQTIVIKANIYTTKAYSRESNSASMNTYNRAVLIKKYYENIKAQYIVKNESGEEVVYNVSFEINVGKPESNRRVAMEKTRADSEGNMFNASLAGERNTSPNTGEFTGWQPMRDEDTGELRMINKLGFTEPFDLIFVEGTNDEKPNKWTMTDLHEFGHVLLSLVQYFHDQDGTFTQSDETSPGTPGHAVPVNFIENILGNVGIGNGPVGPPSDRPNANVTQSGKPVKGFTKGNVKNVQNNNGEKP